MRHLVSRCRREPTRATPYIQTNVVTRSPRADSGKRRTCIKKDTQNSFSRLAAPAENQEPPPPALSGKHVPLLNKDIFFLLPGPGDKNTMSQAGWSANKGFFLVDGWSVALSTDRSLAFQFLGACR